MSVILSDEELKVFAKDWCLNMFSGDLKAGVVARVRKVRVKSMVKEKKRKKG